MRLCFALLTLVLCACVSGPHLDCSPAYGSCSASIEQQGTPEWWIVTDTQYALVTLDDGRKLPIAEYKRWMGNADFGIAKCQACVKKVKK